jgi:hypothetical protein
MYAYLESLTVRQQQTIAQPFVEILVEIRLLQVDIAAQDLLHVLRLGQLHVRYAAQPKPKNSIELIGDLGDFGKAFCDYRGTNFVRVLTRHHFSRLNI